MNLEQIKVVDADAHVVERADTFTNRMSKKKWGDKLPHVRTHPETGLPTWMVNGVYGMPVAAPAMAGWKEWPPSFPATLEEVPAACFDAKARLKWMTENSIHAGIIYPSLGSYGAGLAQYMGEPELQMDCTRAYNDFMGDWCRTDARRLYGIGFMPFWDVQASVAEMKRCREMGLVGMQLTTDPASFGLAQLGDPHWSPIWAAAQELDMPICFHVGTGAGGEEAFSGYEGNGRQSNFAKGTVSFFLDNARSLMEMVGSGVCHRYPKLKIISAEHGIGWIPFVLEAFDWQWTNCGAFKEHPEMDLLPSEYFKRQIYASFWFENASARAAIAAAGADNFFFETDFPHPTSMSPGPASSAVAPARFIETVLGREPESVQRKVLSDNAARVFNLSL